MHQFFLNLLSALTTKEKLIKDTTRSQNKPQQEKTEETLDG